MGLAAVVLCLAAFSTFAAYTTETQLDRARYYGSQHDSYATANALLVTDEVAQLEDHLLPSSEHGAERSAADKAVVDALNEIAGQGSRDDGQLAREALALHDEYLVVYAKLAMAVNRGDQPEVDRLRNEKDLWFHAMRDQITAATGQRRADSESAFAVLRATTQWILIASPLVFAIGFGLLFGLWRILEREHRATRETYRQIEQLGKLRSEFVSIVSHEFRTPLTGIQGFSELMRDEELTPAQTREYAGDINKDARRLARLITDMLDLDRMESGRMTLDAEPVDLNRIISEAAAQFRLSAADHPIELDLDPHLPFLVGDDDRLTQVVTNLLSNAIKYSPSGGAVELRTKRAARTVTFTVRDHGMGIPAEQLETIFDRYSRVETTETRTIQGTGLGLPIVRQIVQLSDGEVWATSEPGEGAVLHVRLPLVEAAALAPLAA